MPKRTTTIQTVIELIEQLNSSGVTVTGSKMLVDKDSNTEREVDIVLEGTFNNHPFIVSVEVVERGRKADQMWVEQMSGKHASLPTDKLVLVSNSGFTEPAVVKAKSLKIGTYDLRTQKIELKQKVEEIATIESLEIMMGLYVDGELVMPDCDFEFGSTKANVSKFLYEFLELANIPEELLLAEDGLVVKRIGESPSDLSEEGGILFFARLVDRFKESVEFSVVNYQGVDYLYGGKKSDLNSLSVTRIDKFDD